jgi:hypothetical protein
MITHYKEDHRVEVRGMKILKKYEKLAKYILIDCGGVFIQNPSHEGDYFVFEGISFDNSEAYNRFERQIRIHTTDFVEIRNDNRWSYFKNRIRLFFSIHILNKRSSK